MRKARESPAVTGWSKDRASPTRDAQLAEAVSRDLADRHLDSLPEDVPQDQEQDSSGSPAGTPLSLKRMSAEDPELEASRAQSTAQSSGRRTTSQSQSFAPRTPRVVTDDSIAAPSPAMLPRTGSRAGSEGRLFDSKALSRDSSASSRSSSSASFHSSDFDERHPDSGEGGPDRSREGPKAVTKSLASAVDGSTKGLLPVSSRSAAEPQDRLFGFQRRSIRHSRQNWKAAPSTDNALCLPKPEAAVQAMIDRMQGRHRLVPIALRGRGQGAAATVGKQPSRAVSVTMASSSVPPDSSQNNSGAHTATTTPPPQSQSAPAGDGEHTATSTKDRAPSESSRQLHSGTAHLFFSRQGTPASELPTSVIPSVHQAPLGLSYSSRPQSQVLIPGSVLSPPGTASQLLSQNLFGFPGVASLDSTINFQSGGGGCAGQGNAQGGALIGGSVIGALRPNSVLRRPPIAVSTSLGAQGELAPAPAVVRRDHLPPDLPRPKRDKPAVEWSRTKADALRGGGNLGGAADARALAFVGDPEEVLLGAGMFAVVHPSDVQPPVELDALFVGGGTSSQHANVDVAAKPRARNSSHVGAAVGGGGGAVAVPRGGASPKRSQARKEALLGPLRDDGTPQRLLTFGLKELFSQSDGDILGDEVRAAQQQLQQKSLDLFVGNRADATVDNEDQVRVGKRSGPPPTFRLPSLSPSRSASPARSIDAPPRVDVVAISNSPTHAEAQRAKRAMDPVDRVVEVCRWGYDLRSLFLVQLARDQMTLPRFVALQKQPIELWVRWLQHGGPLPTPSQAQASDIGVLASSWQSRKGASAAAGPSARERSELEKVIYTACEYVGATFLRGRHSHARKFNIASGARDAVPSTEPARMNQSPFVPDQQAPQALDRATVRKALVDQGLHVADVCAMFRDQMGPATPQELQRKVKSWLTDPSLSDAKVEACMRYFMTGVETLRDDLIDCLKWNAEERTAYQYFEEVVHSLPKASNDSAKSPSTTGSPLYSVEDPDDSRAIVSLSPSRNARRVKQDPLEFVIRMQAIVHKFEHAQASRSNRTELEKLPSTVEDFSAQHYLPHADVCAWLARCSTFDRRILPSIWRFVVQHKSQRSKWMQPLIKLQQLLAVYEEFQRYYELGDRALYEPQFDRSLLVDESEAIAARSAATTSGNKSPLQHRVEHVRRDQFVLESVISRLQMMDEDDWHNGAFHKSAAAPYALPGCSPSQVSEGSSGLVVENVQQHRWRSLLPRFVAHREQLFRQDAELLKNVMSKRTEPHRRVGLEKAVQQWRDEPPAPSSKPPRRPLDISGAPDSDALIPSNTHEAEFQPVCKETLREFLQVHRLGSKVPASIAGFLFDKKQSL